jgi:glutaredoxin 3
MPADVTIYTTRLCGYCIAAKRLLAARGIPYEEIDVTSNNEKRAWLAQATGRRKVPQIFIGSEAIGGYDELAAMDRAGGLRERVGG